MPTCPALVANAKISALPTPDALIAWLPWMNLGRFAAQEMLRVGNKFAIAIRANALDAGPGTALDLVKEARPVPVVEETVRAGTEQEEFLQRIDCGVDRAGAGERAVIIALGLAGAPVLLDAREGMIGSQQDEGKTFVIPQQHIVGRAVALDELCFEEQRFHPPNAVRQPFNLRIVGHPVAERPGLADIKDITPRIVHPINARLGRQGFQDIADRCNAGFKVRLIHTANGVGLLFLVETIRCVGLGHWVNLDAVPLQMKRFRLRCNGRGDVQNLT